METVGITYGLRLLGDLCNAIHLLLSVTAILTYRVFRSASKKITKFVHLFLNLVALVLSITAVTAVYTTHVDNGLPNLYSIHGWIGLSTVIMFGLQVETNSIPFMSVLKILQPENWCFSSSRV